MGGEGDEGLCVWGREGERVGGDEGSCDEKVERESREMKGCVREGPTILKIRRYSHVGFSHENSYIGIDSKFYILSKV